MDNQKNNNSNVDFGGDEYIKENEESISQLSQNFNCQNQINNVYQSDFLESKEDKHNIIYNQKIESLASTQSQEKFLTSTEITNSTISNMNINDVNAIISNGDSKSVPKKNIIFLILATLNMFFSCSFTPMFAGMWLLFGSLSESGRKNYYLVLGACIFYLIFSFVLFVVSIRSVSKYSKTFKKVIRYIFLVNFILIVAFFIYTKLFHN